MRTIPHNFDSWPRTNTGDPIFACSEAAIFYAHLIMDKVQERTRLAKLRQKVLLDLKVMRASDHPNLQRMMDLAVKGQFYRECLEELDRIEKEVKS